MFESQDATSRLVSVTRRFLGKSFLGAAKPRRRKLSLGVSQLEGREVPANLLANPSVETTGIGSSPAGWQTDSFGSNTAAFTYPAPGIVGPRGVRVDVSGWSSGDAKWRADDVTITPGAVYDFSNQSISDTATSLTVRYLLSNGTYSYLGLGSVPGSATARTNTASFTAPANAVSATVFHLLQSNGYLITDDYSLEPRLSGTDTTAPNVAITDPLAGVSLSGNFNVAANATDAVGVAGVQFFVNGLPLGAEDTIAPYNALLDTSTLANAAHVITAVARDAAGNTRTSVPVTFTASNAGADNTPPDVTVTGPLANAALSGNATLMAIASDNKAVGSVRFSVDGTPVGSLITSSPYSFTLDTKTLTNGVHTITATARDTAGNSKTSASISVTVTNDIVAPNVTVIAPGANANVSGNAALLATATDNVKVTSVQFAVDGTLVGTPVTSGTFGYILDTKTLSNGPHVITAIARDAAGNSKTSSPVTVNVINDSTPPAVTVTAPSANAVLVGNATLTANATDNVAVQVVRFYVDGVPVGPGNITAAPYTLVLDTKTLSNGTHTIKAVARDAAGLSTNSANVVVTVNNPVPDTVAPNVSVTAPLPSAVLAGTTSLTAAATDNVAVTSVQFAVNGILIGTPITAAPYTFSLNTKSLVNGTHSITAIARDAAGNSKTSAAVSVTVTNVPDTTAPMVSVTAPAANAVLSGNFTLTATATDNVAVQAVRFYVDGVPVGPGNITTAPYTLVLDTKTLTNGTHTIKAVARDTSGISANSANVIITVNNTTPDTVFPTVSVTAPLVNATLTGNATLTATAADNIGVASVQFAVDGILVGTPDTVAPYSFVLNTMSLTNGAHQITAIARDAAGNSRTSVAVAVTVNNPVPDTVFPTVSVTAPLVNAALTGNATLTATASDNVGVASVQFAVDGTLVGTPVTTAPFTITLDTKTLANGARTITAIAKDAAGNTTISAGIAVTVSNTAAAVNLIANPSLETSPVNGDPTGWLRGGYGTNTPVYTYPVAGTNGARAARVELTSRTDGDVKWFFNPVAVTAGQTYAFSNSYRSNVASQLLIQYQLTGGTFQYAVLSDRAAAANWTNTNHTITVPAGVVSLTVFHLIQSVGWLEVDNYSLTSSTVTPPPAAKGLVTFTFDDGWNSQYNNALPILESAGLKGSFYIISQPALQAQVYELVVNPSLETANGATPANWAQRKTGTNTANFTYPATGRVGNRSARVDVTSFTNGDAAWAYQAVTVTPGQRYTLSNQYSSTAQTTLAVQYTRTDNTTFVVDLATLTSTNNAWRTVARTLTIPAGVQSMTVMQQLRGTGSVTVDDFSVKLVPTAVTDNTYFGPTQVRALEAAGMEVGAHTRTHSSLPTLSTADATAEIAGSRTDLLGMGVSQINTMVYPYGDYNTGVQQIVANSGYIGARTVEGGYNTSSTPRYQLATMAVERDTTIEEIRGWIDQAEANDTWLILMLHKVDNDPNDFYGTTPAIFQQAVDYVKAQDVDVVTMREGLARTAPPA